MEQSPRQRWLAVLARSSTDDLKAAFVALAPEPDYSLLRPPETGLVMVRGRAGGDGARFNLGEMTVSRCAIRLPDGTVGHGYVAGRDQQKAELVAVFDALLQDPAGGPGLLETLIQPLARRLAQRREAEQARTDATRVDFFTLVRGD